jgi:putative membrane protein
LASLIRSSEQSMPPQLQSPEIQAFATGIPVALGDAGITLVILLLGAAIYALLTPHREIQLIRDGNTAAAMSLAGVLIGLAIPLSASLGASNSKLEIAIWGVMIIAVQLLVFRVIDLVLHGLPQRIQDGEISAATLLVGAKIGSALILAAAMR